MIRTDREINVDKILSFVNNDIIVILNIGNCTLSDTGVESCRPNYLHVYHLPTNLTGNFNIEILDIRMSSTYANMNEIHFIDYFILNNGNVYKY